MCRIRYTGTIDFLPPTFRTSSTGKIKKKKVKQDSVSKALFFKLRTIEKILLHFSLKCLESSILKFLELGKINVVCIFSWKSWSIKFIFNSNRPTKLRPDKN